MTRLVLLAGLVASAAAFAPVSRPFMTKTALSAEPEWAPADGEKWEEKNWESELQSLQSEAEDRLDKKIEELMSNIEEVGKK